MTTNAHINVTTHSYYLIINTFYVFITYLCNSKYVMLKAFLLYVTFLRCFLLKYQIISFSLNMNQKLFL